MNDNLITINNAIEVDLYGQVCSESSGFRQITGTGGQLDFILAGYESRGGKSIVCLPSSYKDKEGKTRSRIVPFLPHGGIVTAPRRIAHIIVTEYGKFNLKAEEHLAARRGAHQHRPPRHAGRADQGGRGAGHLAQQQQAVTRGPSVTKAAGIRTQ